MVASLSVAVAAGGVRAQEIDDIPVVIVTAQRMEASAREVPVAMSAIPGSYLEDNGIDDIAALADRTPALDLQSNAGPTTASLRIRRVGNIGNIPTFEPAVATFVDGAFRSRSFLATQSLLGVDRVEVLRGPQNALYGKNSSAGIVAIHTAEPSERFTAETELTQGLIDSPESAALSRITLEASGPLTSNTGGAIAARFDKHDHTLLNVLPGGPDGDNKRAAVARAQLSWTPSQVARFRILAGGTRARSDQGESDVFLESAAASAQVSGVLQQLGLTPECPDNVPRNRRLCSVATNESDIEATDVTLLGEYGSRNDRSFKSITSFDEYDISRIEDDAIQLFAPMLFYHDIESGRSFQQELTFLSTTHDDLSWLVGAFYYRNDYERGGDGIPMFGANGALAYDSIWPALLGVPLAIPGQVGIHDSRLDTRYVSVFGQASWRLTPKLELSARLRWQDERKDATITNAVTAPGISLISAVLTPVTTLGGEAVNGTLSRATDSVPWSITPLYRLSDDAMLYVTLARGTKSGGFNTGFGDAPLAEREFSDEKVHHYEVGAKFGFARRMPVTLDAAAFHTRFDDFQDAAFISAQFSVGNAETVDLKGIEVDATLLLHERLTMRVAVSFADLRYATNTNGLCHPRRPPDGREPTSCVLSGERLINAPEWETDVAVRYEHPIAAGAFFASIDWAWTDDYNTSFSADPFRVQSAYSNVALRVGWQIGRMHEITLWGDNVLDETISHFDSLLNLFNDTSYQSYLAESRSYGATWRFRF